MLKIEFTKQKSLARDKFFNNSHVTGYNIHMAARENIINPHLEQVDYHCKRI